jgi:YgiT-type zinc finger domain-containing protein
MSDETIKPDEKSNFEQESDYPHICPECHTGVFRLEYLTYFTWLNDELITVPKFPSWVCDVCGKREYDSHAVSWLNVLLSPTTGRKPKIRRRRKPPKNLNRPQPQS